MKYLIAGIIGGVVSTIWSVAMIFVGMFISYDWVKSDAKNGGRHGGYDSSKT